MNNKNKVVFLYSLFSVFWYLLPPILGYFLAAYHPKTYLLSDKEYIYSLVYIFMYNSLFFIFINLFNNYKTINFHKHIKKYSHNLFKPTVFRIRFLVLSIFAFGIISKIYQNSLGKFRMLDGSSDLTFNQLKLESTPILQLTKSFASLEILSFLIFSYFLRKKMFNKKVDKMLYVLMLIIIQLAGIYSGSRFQTIFPLIILIYVFFDKIKYHRRILILPSIFFSFFYIAAIVPALSFYRNIAKYLEVSAFDILMSLDFTNLNYFDSFKDVVSTRLNGLHGLQIAIEYFMENEKVDFFYHFNFIALIPRAIWKNKPTIGLDLNEYAWKMGLINDLDYSTSVGFGGLYGDSFIQFGYWGVLVAAFHAYLFYILKSIYQEKDNNPILYAYTFLFAKMLMTTGTFMAILPTIIYLFIPSIFFVYLINARAMQSLR